MSTACKLTAFALAFGLSGVVALPSGSDVAWGDDVPVITVTAKKETGLTPDKCREMGYDSIEECIYRNGGYSAANPLLVDAGAALSEAAQRNCRRAVRAVKQSWPRAAAAAMGGATAILACAELPAPHSTACKVALAGAVAACATVGGLMD